MNSTDKIDCLQYFAGATATLSLLKGKWEFRVPNLMYFCEDVIADLVGRAPTPQLAVDAAWALVKSTSKDQGAYIMNRAWNGPDFHKWDPEHENFVTCDVQVNISQLTENN